MEIYQKSRDAAQEAVEKFKKGSQCVGVYAPFQSGKMQATCEIAYQFVNNFDCSGFVFDCGTSDKGLQRQQGARIKNYRAEPFEFYGDLFKKLIGQKAFHLPNSNKKSKKDSEIAVVIKGAIAEGYKNILLIRDEADFAAGDASNLQKLLKAIDFPKETKIFLCIVTATPYPILHAAKERNFKVDWVVPKIGSDYYGLNQHHKRGLILQTYNPVKDTDTFNKDMKSYVTNFKDKYYVLRCTSRKQNSIFEIAAQKGIKVKEYNSREGNILELKEDLKTPCNKPTLVLINRSYGAGITLDKECNNNIYRWHDAPFNKNDRASVQSAARSTGYKDPFDFQILMDLKSYKRWEVMDTAFSEGRIADAENAVMSHGARLKVGKSKSNVTKLENYKVVKETKKRKICEDLGIDESVVKEYRISRFRSLNIAQAVNDWVDNYQNATGEFSQVGKITGTYKDKEYLMLIVDKKPEKAEFQVDYNKIPDELLNSTIILKRKQIVAPPTIKNNSVYAVI